MAGRMRIETPRIVQPGSSRLQVWVILGVLLVLLGLAAFKGFEYSQDRSGEAEQRLTAEVKRLEGENGVLEETRRELRGQVAALERQVQVDQEATRQVREELNRYQDQRLEMEKELNLLRGIVAEGVDSKGLYVQGFSLSQGADANSFEYRFTVSQMLTDAGTATGWIHLTLDGEQDGEPSSLTLKDVSEEAEDKLKMRFNHFQDVKGDIRLPEGFLPHRVTVEIKPTNKKLSPITKHFGWLVAG